MKVASFIDNPVGIR